MDGLRKATCNPKIKNPYFSRSRGHQPAPGRMVYSANPIASKIYREATASTVDFQG